MCQASRDGCRRSAPHWRFVLIVVLVLASVAESHDHQISVALHRILGEDVLSLNGARLLQQITDDPRKEPLSAADRLRIVMDWMFPDAAPESIRLSAEFTPASLHGSAAYCRHGLRAPVFALLEMCESADDFAQVRSEVEHRSPTTDIDQRRQTAMRALISISQREFPAALEQLDRLLEEQRLRPIGALEHRWPETLVIVAACQHPELRPHTDEAVQRILHEQIRRARFHGPDPWDRLFANLAHQPAEPAAGTETGPADQRGFRQWCGVSQQDFGTHGWGFPAAHWQRSGSTAALLAHHQHDSLYFQSPLQGTFAVEFQSTGFGYHESRPTIAGLWAGPGFDHRTVDRGFIHLDLPPLQLTSPLSEIRDWMRYRVTVDRDQTVISVNGRTLVAEPARQSMDPWFAIRFPFWTYGQIRDVRITGDAAVPEEILLSEDPELRGWSSWYGGSLGVRNVSDWWWEPDTDGQGVIVGRHQQEYSGCLKEALLQYHRPVQEDGVIEYEFWSESGQSNVHPSIGRHVILLDALGPALHVATDARFDQTAADPGQRRPLPKESGLVTMPLNDRSWNRVRLEFRAGDVFVTLNDQAVTRLPMPQSRVFGLYCDAGESAARVKNIRWRGHWPKIVPAISNQELADPLIPKLDDARRLLPARFECDLTRQEFSAALFQIHDEGAERFVTQTSQGLEINAVKSDSGYSRVSVSPFLEIEGDFDAIAEFAELRPMPSSQGRCDIVLQVALTDPAISHFATALTDDTNPGQRRRRSTEQQLFQLNPFGLQMLGQQAEDSDRGKLRLVRNGRRMYSLIAAGDSQDYRLVGVADCGEEKSRLDGIRMLCGLQSGVTAVTRTHAVWKSLSVAAERLTGAAADRQPVRLR